MGAGVELEIEIIRPRNPLSPPPRTGFLSPTLLDSLLGLLPLRSSPEPREPAPVSRPQSQELLPELELELELEPLDLGLTPSGDHIEDDDGAPGDERESDEDLSSDEREIASATDGPSHPKNLQARLRGLNAAEQQRLARRGEQDERVALERIYGKAVWENLLRNPKITPPEVARIARMGTVPQPLMEAIVGNRSWLGSAQVRRALLQNRRLKNEMILSVLRATPKSELRLVPKQTAYSAAVREAAVKLIK